MSRRKTERLLNLVICLLATRRPLTAEQIRQAVPGYDRDSDEAFQRMFERDKNELREIGIPIRGGARPWEGEPGYRIERQAYELPEITLEPDEAAVLGLAAQVWQRAALAGAASGALLKLRAAGVETDEAVGPAVRAAGGHPRPGLPGAVGGGAGPARGAVRLPGRGPRGGAHPDRGAVGRGEPPRPLVPGGPRPRPRRAAGVPAQPHRRRGAPGRQARPGDRARGRRHPGHGRLPGQAARHPAHRHRAGAPGHLPGPAAPRHRDPARRGRLGRARGHLPPTPTGSARGSPASARTCACSTRPTCGTR